MSRKRGRLAVTTTGSRTIMSTEAAPTRADVQATAVMRTAPLNAGNSNGNLGLAVGADLDDAGEQSERRLCRQIAFEIAAAVAADMQRAGDALHAVDQIAVEIAHLQAELALAEEVARGIGRLVVREVEDADVDRRDRHARLLAGGQAGKLDGDGDGLARPRLVRRGDGQLQLARGLVDLEPGDAHGARRHALLLDVERALGDRDRIGAGAPIAADVERHDIVALLEVDLDQLLQFVADQRDRRLAGVARGDAELGALAGRVVLFVERDGGVVGRVGAGRAGPTDVEGEARRLAFGSLDVEPVLAPADDARELGGLGGRGRRRRRRACARI